MKVLHIITRLDPGGSSYICRTMAGKLRDRGFNVVLASGKSTVSYEDVARLRHLRRKIGLLRDFMAVIEAYKLIRRVNPDILHLHTSKAGMVGRIAGRLAGVKRIYYQPHGIVFYGYFGRFKSRIILLIEKVLAGFADKIIVLTRKAKDEFLDCGVGKAQQYEVIENGIELNKFTPLPVERKNEIRKEYGIASEDIVLGMAGRIVKLKGHAYFIEAMEKIISEYDNVTGLIAGEGDYENELRRKIKKKKLSDRIIFTGHKEDIREIMQAIDVLVQPSVVEGFGLAVIEAAACRVPAIGFKVGGLIDIIKSSETGILVDYKDVNCLYDAMLYFIENPEERLMMGERAYEHVRDNFTVDIMMNKLLDLYG